MLLIVWVFFFSGVVYTRILWKAWLFNGLFIKYALPESTQMSFLIFFLFHIWNFLYRLQLQDRIHILHHNVSYGNSFRWYNFLSFSLLTLLLGIGHERHRRATPLGHRWGGCWSKRKRSVGSEPVKLFLLLISRPDYQLRETYDLIRRWIFPDFTCLKVDSELVVQVLSAVSGERHTYRE